MGLWRVYTIGTPRNPPPPGGYSATLEYLGYEQSWYLKNVGYPFPGTPGTIDYVGDGEFFFSSNHNTNPYNIDCWSFFYFHLHYDGPTVHWPFSIHIGVTMEHVDGEFYSYNAGLPTPSGPAFTLFSAAANTGAQPWTKYGHTMYGLWGGSAPGRSYANLATHLWWVSDAISPATNTDWWLVFDFIYTQVNVDSHIKLHTLWYEDYNPPSTGEVTLLTEP